MRKLGFVIFAIAAAVLVSACAADVGKPDGTAEHNDVNMADYFPANENTRLVYQGEGSEYASYQVYTDYTKDGYMQQRVDTGGTTVVRVIRTNKNRVEVVFSAGEIYYRQNMLDMEKNPPEPLLKAPLETGHSWLLGDGRIRTVTGIGIPVETPAGNFETLEVTSEGPYGKAMDYYAKGVGLVKTVYISEGGPVISALSKVERDVPLTQKIRFWYPNVSAGKLGYIDKEADFFTNDITRKVLAEAYTETPPEPLGSVFTPGTEINSLYLNDDGMVYIDLNKAFRQEMNAGAAYEQMILQSVANTFAHYYGVTRVLLTVDGQPYESGHIVLRPGEYLTADDSSADPAAALPGME